MTTTSVVLVAFRSRDDLEQGLPVLLEDPSVGRVVVVDNSSDPSTADLLRDADQRVRYVDPGENLGFARACNLGMRLTDDPVVTFLNPDVLLTHSLRPLVDSCLESGPQLLAGGLSRDMDGSRLTNARRRVTLPLELRRCLLGSAVSQRPIASGAGRVPVAQVDGALLMGTRAFLDALGGFDERFELYFEDVDLCDRARARGRVVLDARCYGNHAGGQSSTRAAPASYCVFRVSRVRYFAKKSGIRGAAAALVLTTLEIVVRSLTRQPEGARVRLRALHLAAREMAHPRTVRVLA